MASDFKVTVDVELNQSSLQDIINKIKNIGANNKIVLEVDASKVTDALNKIKSQIEALSKIKITFGEGTGTSSVNSATKQVNELTQAFQRLQSIQKEISRIQIKMIGLDESSNECKVLQQQLESLTKEAQDLRAEFSKSFSTEQMQKLQDSMDKTTRKAEELKAKLADALTAKYDNSVEQNMSKIQSAFDNTKNKSEELQKAMDRLYAAMDNMNAAKQTGDLEKISSAYKEYESALKEVQNALQATEVAQKSVTLSNNMETWLNNNKRAAAEYGEQIRELQAQLQDNTDPVFLKQASQEFQNIKSQANAAGLTVQSFTKQLGSIALQVAGITSVAVAIRKVIEVGKQAVETVKEIDSAMAQLQIVTKATDSDMTKFLEESISLAKELGQSVDDVIDSITTYSRLGYNLEDASSLAEYTGILSNVAAVSTEEATSGITSIIKGFGLDVSDMEHVSDVLIEIGNNYAVSASEILTAFENSSAAMSASGTTFEESAAIIAAGNAAVQDANKVGTALKTVSARIRGSKSDLQDLGEDYEDLANGFSKYADELQALTGFSILEPGTTDTYKSLYEIFDGIAACWDNLSDTVQSRVSEILGGTRQLQIISSIMNNWEDATNAYADAMNVAGVATETNAIYMDTFEAKTKQLSASLTELAVDILNTNFLKGVVTFADQAIQAFDKVVDSAGAVGAAFAGIGVTAFAATFISAMNSCGLTVKDLAKDMSLIPSVFAEISGVAVATSASIAGLAAIVVTAVAGIEYFNHETTRAYEAADEARDAYDKEKSTLQSLEDEYTDVTSRIEELNEAKTNGDITIQQQIELDNLEAQSAELERQIALHEDLLASLQEEAALASAEALNSQVSYLEYLEEENGKVGGFFKYLAEGFQTYVYNPASGEIETYESDLTRWGESDTSISGLIQQNLSDIADYEQDLKYWQEILNKDPTNQTALANQTELQQKITDTTSALTTEREVLSNYMSDLVDETTGMALPGYENIVDSYQDLLNQIAKMDLEPLEKELYDIQTFFDGSIGSDALSKYLTEAVANGDDLEEALARVGLRLSDIGSDVSIETLTRYFQELAATVEDVDEALQAVDGSVAGVEAAFESSNQNDTWKEMCDYLSQANDLYEQQLIGLDDFQAAAQFITADTIMPTGDYSADSEAFAEAWEASIDKINRYFDAENPLTSMKNAVDDLVSSGLAEYIGDSSSSLVRWTDDFTTTAQAAEALGLNVEATEVILHALEAYGADFGDIFFSAEELQRFDSTLDSLKAFYNTLDDGVEKTRLGKLIEGWDEDLAKYQDDINELTKDQIIHIEFEYDLATIQAEIDQLNSLIDAGARTVDNYSKLISANFDYINTAMNGLGMNQEGFEIPVVISGLEEEIDRLQNELAHASGEDIIRLQAEIVNLQEIEKGVLNAFADTHPTINAESNIDDIEAAWEDFLNKPQRIYVDASLNDEEIKSTLDSLAQGSWIVFQADVDGVTQTVKAIENEKGEVTYTAMIDGVLTTLEYVGEQDGVVTYHADITEAENALDQLEGQVITYYAAVDEVSRTVSEITQENGVVTYTAQIDGVTTEVYPIEEEDGTITYTADLSQVNESVENLGFDDKVINFSDEGADTVKQDVQAITDATNAMPDDATVHFDELGADDVEGAAQEIADAIDGIQEDVSTEFTENGAENVENAAQEITNAVEEVPEDASTEFTESGSENVIGASNNVGEAIEEVPEDWNTSFTQDGAEVVQEAASTTKSAIEDVPEDWGTSFTQDGAETVTSAAQETKAAIEDIPEEWNTDISEKGSGNVISAANDVTTALKNIPETIQTIISQSGASDVVNAANNVKNALNAIDKNVKVNITETTTKKTVTENAQGTAHSEGTAHREGSADSMGSAYKSGSWRVGKDERALVGELGQELVVRDGRYFTVGDNGAELVNLQADDIVFNHKQTQAILANGFVNERGSFWGNIAQSIGSAVKKAYAWGTALVNGSAFASGSAYDDGTDDEEEENTFSKTFDWISTKIDRIEREISSLDLKVKSTYSTWSSRNSALSGELSAISREINIQQQAYNKYMSYAESLGLSSYYKNLVKNGAIDIATIEDEELADLIDEYQKYYNLAIECLDSIESLNDNISDLYKTAFDNVQREYEEVLDVIDFYKSMINEAIEQSEAKGYLTSTKYYDALMQQEQDNILQLEKERDALLKSINDAVRSGAIAEGSEEWYEMCSAVDSVTLAIEEANTALLEYQKTIRELNWDVFDLVESRISKITDESDFLIKLLENSELYTDTGQLTDTGLATMGLYGLNYNTYLAESERLASELKSLQKDIANDPYNQDLIDRYDELLEKQQELILSAEDMKQSIKSLVSEGIEKEIESVRSLVSEYESLLDSQKDLYSFQKSVAEQSSEIAKIEKEIAAYANDMSEETKATVQRLRTQLSEAQSNLESTQMDEYLTQEKKLLDNLVDEYESVLNTRLDDIDSLISDVISQVNDSAYDINKTIVSTANDVGYTLSSEMSSIWNINASALSSVLTEQGTNVSSALTTTNSVLNTISSNVASMMDSLDLKASSATSSATTSSATTTSKIKQSTTTTNTNNNTTTTNEVKAIPIDYIISDNSNSSANADWGSWFVYSKDSYPKNKLNVDTSIVDRLKYFDFDSSFSARRNYFYAMGGSGTYTGTAKQNTWMISEMKSHGYAQGGTVGELIKQSGEDGLILARTGEEVLSIEKINALKEAFVKVDSLLNSIEDMGAQKLSNMKSFSEKVKENTIDNVNFEVVLPNVSSYEDFRRELQHDSTFENMIRDMTVNRLFDGGSKIKKYKY